MKINRNQRKRQFIQWLLQHFRHNNPVVDQFLHFLMTEPNCIQYITFTEASHYTPRGIYISYKTRTDTPFMYYKYHRQYTKCEQAFHDFRLNMQISKEQFYIELDIPKVYQVLSEFDVFEENPYLPQSIEKENQIEHLLSEVSSDVLMNYWRSQIDEGLANHNYEQVEYYLQLIEKKKGE